MKIHNISYDDMLNGDGLRCVLWVSGCNHHCPGCQNPITHDPNDGAEMMASDFEEICNYLENEYAAGITYSGGDPLFPENREMIEFIASALRRRHSRKTQWLYTGYLWEQVKHLPVMQYIDVLVDGPFIQALADVNYHWAGSRHQRVIDVQRSLQQDKVILYDNVVYKSQK